jgi:hypothetical protein
MKGYEILTVLKFEARDFYSKETLKSPQSSLSFLISKSVSVLCIRMALNCHTSKQANFIFVGKWCFNSVPSFQPDFHEFYELPKWLVDFFDLDLSWFFIGKRPD